MNLQKVWFCFDFQLNVWVVLTSSLSLGVFMSILLLRSPLLQYSCWGRYLNLCLHLTVVFWSVYPGAWAKVVFYSWSLFLNCKWIPVFIRRNIWSIGPDFLKFCPRLGRRVKIVRVTIPSPGTTILVPYLADGSAWSAPAKCKQGFLPSALTPCPCLLCRAQHWLLSCLLSVPLHGCWSPFGSQGQVVSCLYFSDDVEVKELTTAYSWLVWSRPLQSLAFLLIDTWHFWLTPLLTGVYSTEECCNPGG